MAQKNQVINHFSEADLERLNYEFHHYIGRDTYLNRGAKTLTVYAYPKDSKKARKAAAKARRRKQEEYPDWDQYER